MKTHATKLTIFFIAGCILSNPLYAFHNSKHDLSDEEWFVIRDRVELLDNINYMPTLLPTIMRNRDVLQLSDQQIKSFRSWRKQHYGDMVNVMNKIIEDRIDFKKAALDPGVSKEKLHEMQDNIILLQKRLLDIKLSCRDMLMGTFTAEQWDNFAFVVADDPKLASFIQ